MYINTTAKQWLTSERYEYWLSTWKKTATKEVEDTFPDGEKKTRALAYIQTAQDIRDGIYEIEKAIEEEAKEEIRKHVNKVRHQQLLATKNGNSKKIEWHPLEGKDDAMQAFKEWRNA